MMMRQCTGNEKGYLLLGLILAFALAGGITAWGLSLLKPTALEQNFRTQGLNYLDEARRALFIYAEVNGTLPASVGGVLPWQVLGVKPKDPWGRTLQYQVDSGLLTTRNQSCEKLKNQPAFTAASIVSAGPKSTADDTADDLAAAIQSPALYSWLKSAAVDQTIFNWTSCTAPHCSNGLKDADETGTDCGGNDCNPCT